ncbi:hypothetical protein WJX72_008749 [[Myrmecia] bisecta]|uniref:Uncharacterized protein n=1 Tax=[Myrmecia] bisecta TaxID=41462 RepID=A0AAW1R7Z1_9CHLO
MPGSIPQGKHVELALGLCLQPRTAQAYLHKQQAFNSLAHSVTDEDEGVPLDITLEPGIRLMQQTLRVGDMALILVVPADIDAVMDMYIDRGQEDRDPYWTRPWPSAVALAQEILERPELVRGKRVCELGAGLGVAAIAAAKAGAAEVVVLDREPLALQCALLSAVASGGAKYDVVLACDVLYEDFSVEPVAAAVPSMLKSSGTRLLLTDPAHRTEHNRKKFIELLRCGRDPFQVEEMASRDIEMDATTTDVQLMIFRRSLGGDTIGVKRL